MREGGREGASQPPNPSVVPPRGCVSAAAAAATFTANLATPLHEARTPPPHHASPRVPSHTSQERSAATELELQSQLQFCRQALARALQAQRQASGEALPDEWGEPLPPPAAADEQGGGLGSTLAAAAGGGSVSSGLGLGGGLGGGGGGASRHATPQQVEMAMAWAEELMGEVRPKHLADGGTEVGGGGAAEVGGSDLEARLARRVEAAAIASSAAV